MTIEWLDHGVLTAVRAHATQTNAFAWLCIGLAAVLLSLRLRGWMKAHDYHSWENMLWSVALTIVLLLGSCSITGWTSSQRVETPPSEEIGAVGTRPAEDIRGRMLAGARFKKAKLNGENLHGAMLAGADLRGADLESADLRRAMLLGANLSGANLVNANLEGAMLLGAHLEGARIDGANFEKAAFLTQDQIDETCGKPKVLPGGLKAPKPC